MTQCVSYVSQLYCFQSGVVSNDSYKVLGLFFQVELQFKENAMLALYEGGGG